MPQAVLIASLLASLSRAQEQMGDTGIEEAILTELRHFLLNMNFPEDLLTYNAEYLEPIVQRKSHSTIVPKIAAQQLGAGGLVGQQTDLGQYLRRLVLAVQSLPFEVELRI